MQERFWRYCVLGGQLMTAKVTIIGWLLLLLGLAGGDAFKALVTSRASLSVAVAQSLSEAALVLSNPVFRIITVGTALWLFGLAAKRLGDRLVANDLAIADEAEKQEAANIGKMAVVLEVPVMMARQSAHANELVIAQKALKDTQARVNDAISRAREYFASPQKWRHGPPVAYNCATILGEWPRWKFIEAASLPIFEPTSPNTTPTTFDNVIPMEAYDPASNGHFRDAIGRNFEKLSRHLEVLDANYESSAAIYMRDGNALDLRLANHGV